MQGTNNWVAAWQNQQNDLCAQRRLRSTWASAQSDQSSLSAWWNLGSLANHWAHIKDSDQTGWMPRLIWIFAGGTVVLLVSSCCGSIDKNYISSQTLHVGSIIKGQIDVSLEAWGFWFTRGDNKICQKVRPFLYPLFKCDNIL